jgi:ADP-heptose:LPS heptosyltransferase
VNIVILRALGLGDMLTAIPALRAVHDAFPLARTTVVAPREPFEALLLRERVASSVSHSVGLAPLDPALGKPRPDLAIDLHGRGPGSQPLLLSLKPRQLIAFRHADIPETSGSPLWRLDEHEVDRWCRLLSESGIPAAATAERLRIDPPHTPVPAVAVATNPTIIHPGAASAARRWGVRRYCEVAREEMRKGRTVLLTGSAFEIPLVTAIARHVGLPDEHVLAGRTSLDSLLALVSAAGRVVCSDTGLAHVATAVGTPSVVLFGPVPPSQWGPPTGSSVPHVALWQAKPGYRGNPHGKRRDPALDAISVKMVLAALDTVP